MYNGKIEDYWLHNPIRSKHNQYESFFQSIVSGTIGLCGEDAAKLVVEARKHKREQKEYRHNMEENAALVCLPKQSPAIPPRNVPVRIYKIVAHAKQH